MSLLLIRLVQRIKSRKKQLRVKRMTAVNVGWGRFYWFYWLVYYQSYSYAHKRHERKNKLFLSKNTGEKSVRFLCMRKGARRKRKKISKIAPISVFRTLPISLTVIAWRVSLSLSSSRSSTLSWMLYCATMGTAFTPTTRSSIFFFLARCALISRRKEKVEKKKTAEAAASSPKYFSPTKWWKSFHI